MKNFKEIFKKKSTRSAAGFFVLGLVFGWLFSGGSGSSDNGHAADIISAEADSAIWTCSMHPHIQQKEAGACPICGMDLIPLDSGTPDGAPAEIRMSPTAMQLANVQSSVIKRRVPVKMVRMNGKVQPDERRVSSQTTHISGRIEKLLVNYTGEYIKKGQVLAQVYSPELVTAQEELFQAYRTRDKQAAFYRAAREKLKNWKLTDKRIDDILRRGKPQDVFPIMADMTGVVLAKKVQLGDHIQSGSSLFEIADLSKVWVLFDIYESDIPWVNKKDEVEFSVHALPGETFKGRISFIDPVINPKTRVSRARFELNNPGQRLKPEMFVKGVVKSVLKNSDEALIVPKTAVMWTGERSVVYVKNTSADETVFFLREVTLGLAVGDGFVIKDGLKEGEEIATHGTFSIDAAAQLAAKPSMMNPVKSGVAPAGNQGAASEIDPENQSRQASKFKINEKARSALVGLIDTYLALKDALVGDDLRAATDNAALLQQVSGKLEMSLFENTARAAIKEHKSTSAASIKAIAAASDIADARTHFIGLSKQFTALARSFAPMQETYFIQHCPMADNNKGADWLSREKNINNPYFGKSMLRCGSTIETIK